MEGNSFSVAGLVFNHPTWEEVRRMQKGGKIKTFETFVWLLLVFVVSVCIDGGNTGLRLMLVMLRQGGELTGS